LYQSRFGSATEDYILALAGEIDQVAFPWFAASRLFTPSGFAQFVSQFFVNLSPVADRKDPDEPGFAIDFIDETKPSELVFPQAG
jgi:hypothetical protein